MPNVGKEEARMLGYNASRKRASRELQAPPHLRPVHGAAHKERLGLRGELRDGARKLRRHDINVTRPPRHIDRVEHSRGEAVVVQGGPAFRPQVAQPNGAVAPPHP